MWEESIASYEAFGDVIELRTGRDDTGRIYVVGKDLVTRAVGIDWKSQYAKIRTLPEFHQMHIYHDVCTQFGIKKTLFLQAELVPILALTIFPNKVKAAKGQSTEVVRQKLQRIKLLREHGVAIITSSFMSEYSVLGFGTAMSEKLGEGKPVTIIPGFVTSVTDTIED